VLAKVSLLRAEQQHDPVHREQNLAEYGIYADLAERVTQASKPMLLITHGFSGSGKSYHAGLLAERLGAVQIRSDVERKRLHGFRPEQSSGSTINGGIYTEDATQLTYERLLAEAQTVLESGFTAIIDATFLKAAQREPFRKLAARCGVAFRILDFQADDQLLSERVLQRMHQGDASEATLDVLRRQQQTAEALTPEERAQAITVDSANERAIEYLLSALPEAKVPLITNKPNKNT
jgi:predicted kinase